MIRNRYATKKQIIAFIRNNNLYALEQVINEALEENNQELKVVIEETGYQPTYERIDGYIVRKIK